MATSDQEESPHLTERLKHLLIGERYGYTSARHRTDGTPICFAARSVRQLFGRAHEVDDATLTRLSWWSELPVAPTAVPALGPLFEEPLVDDDAAHLVRRLVYLWREEDLRDELVAAKAMHALRLIEPPKLLEAVLDHRDSPADHILRRALVLFGWLPQQADDAPLIAQLAALISKYPALIAGIDHARRERFEAEGLISRTP